MTLADQVKHTYLTELIDKCIKEKSIVNNKIIIPYLREQETLIASKVGRVKLKEQKQYLIKKHKEKS
tara:strand:+ start:274 stop:474 length:201 start_codon:yes stop_codon:yes gene_type:complete